MYKYKVSTYCDQQLHWLSCTGVYGPLQGWRRTLWTFIRVLLSLTWYDVWHSSDTWAALCLWLNELLISIKRRHKYNQRLVHVHHVIPGRVTALSAWPWRCPLPRTRLRSLPTIPRVFPWRQDKRRLTYGPPDNRLTLSLCHHCTVHVKKRISRTTL